MTSIEGQTSCSLKFKIKDGVVPLQQITMRKKIKDEEIIDPNLIFQRIAVNMHDKQAELETYLAYELAPYPLYIFKERPLPKNRKSAYYKNVTALREIAYLRLKIVLI